MLSQSPESGSSTPLSYRSEIDGMRALAVLPVMLFHAGFEAFSGGFVGVDVFFVISGYLICYIILGEIETGGFSFIDFYERRARRILPALFFVTMTCAPFAWFWMNPEQLKDFSQSLISVSLFSSNILFWLESDYFAAAAEEKPLLHTWSLAVEEQFYIVAPIILIFVHRYWRDSIFLVVLGFALASLALSQLAVGRYDDANFYLTPFRAWELCAGCLTAMVVRRKGLRENNALAFLGLFAIIGCMVLFDKDTPFPGLSALIPVLGTVMVLVYGCKNTLVATTLSFKPLVGIGLISYSAYLWHQPLFAFARVRLVEAPSRFDFIVLCFVALVLAYLSWRFVERPFRIPGKITKKRVVITSVVSLVVPMSFGLFGQLTDGAGRYRFTSSQIEVYNAIAQSPERDRCHASDTNSLSYGDSCRFFAEENADVAVFGDSHSVELAYALGQHLTLRGRGVRQFSYSDCPPSLGVKLNNHRGCSDWSDEIISQLVKDDEIRTVVLAYRVYGHFYGGHEGHYPEIGNAPDEAKRDAMYLSLARILSELTDAGKQVIFVKQAPELPKHISSLIMRSHSKDMNIKGVPRAWWDWRKRNFDRRFPRVSGNVEIFDPTDLFCDETQCWAAYDGTPLYFDDDHLSIEGAKLVASKISGMID